MQAVLNMCTVLQGDIYMFLKAHVYTMYGRDKHKCLINISFEIIRLCTHYTHI